MPLDRSEIGKIVELQLQLLADLLSKRGLGLVVTEAAREYLAEEGYDSAYGARPIKRVIQQLIQNPLASELLRGGYPEGSTIEVDLDGEKFSFRSISAGKNEPAMTI